MSNAHPNTKGTLMFTIPQEVIARARSLASTGDVYEMSECSETYATCQSSACIHTILISAARAELAREYAERSAREAFDAQMLATLAQQREERAEQHAQEQLRAMR